MARHTVDWFNVTRVALHVKYQRLRQCTKDPYITSGLFLPVIREWMIGSRWNLLQKTSLLMSIFIISYFPWSLLISFPFLVLLQLRFLYELPEFSYRYLLPMLQSWMRVPRSAPNDPRGSKWINMGIWGRETFVPGDHSITTVFEGWMNNSRKGMFTYKKDNGKRSLSLTFQ